MAPWHLRARARIDASTMATRLGIARADLATLERTELGLWEFRTLASYLAALGFVLRVVAVDSRGGETELN